MQTNLLHEVARSENLRVFMTRDINIYYKYWLAFSYNTSSNFYQSIQFCKIFEDTGEKLVYFILQDAAEKTLGLCVGFIRTRRIMKGFLGQKISYLQHASPTVLHENQEFLDYFSGEVCRYIKIIGADEIYINALDSKISPRNLHSYGLEPVRRVEFVVDIHKNEQELISSMSRMRRRRLRKLLKSENLFVIEQENKEGIQHLIQMTHQSHARRSQRGERYDVPNEKAGSSIYKNYIIPRFGRVFIAYSNAGTPLSGIMMHCYRERAYYTMAGSSPDGFQVGASTLVIWKTICELRKEGFRFFNLGGVSAIGRDAGSAENGLYNFKSSFGGKEIETIRWHN